MNAETDWWRTFFSGTSVDFWLAAITDTQTREEADFLEKSLQVTPHARLLDVPCGGGRHCRALAERGYAMTGVDFSTGFLDAARSSKGGSGGAITWENREMRDLPWSEAFDGGYCLGNSFGYLDDNGNSDFVKAASRALKPGARFVLDVGYVAECLFPSLQERGWYEFGDILALSRRRYDHLEGRLHVEFTFIRGGVIEKRTMSARLYTYREIHRLFEAAGFTDVRASSSLAGEPFKLGSNRLLLVATKTGNG